MITRVSQLRIGVQSNCPFPANADRESRSLPVRSLTVYPSRRPYCSDTPIPSVFATSGPETLPRTSRASLLANGTDRLPDQLDSDGLALVTLIKPPSALRPKSALCGPRTNST